MKSARKMVVEIRNRCPDRAAAAIAEELGISRERVRQILVSEGLQTRVKLPRSDPKKRAEYKAWHNMIQRCVDPRHRSFVHYGARGITVCDRWLKSFKSFFDDMGPKPSDRHSLDRVDNDAGYSPENCRWATPHEQAINTRKSSPKWVAEKNKARMSKAQAIKIWRASRYKRYEDALKYMPGWNKMSAYKELGPRNTGTGRPRKS